MKHQIRNGKKKKKNKKCISPTYRLICSLRPEITEGKYSDAMMLSFHYSHELSAEVSELPRERQGAGHVMSHVFKDIRIR